MPYQPSEFESKWQQYWVEKKTFKSEIDHSKKKYYALDMFPYPSGQGLHVGHPEGYTATDILCRYKRMLGFNVLHTMGWDAFGLPAEQYALETGTHPSITTKKNVQNFKRQIQSLGFSYDWDREIDTTDPKYYKWTQWIFLQLYNKGLAYQTDAPVNWCPALKTVLSNEEVIDGKSERGGHPVIRKPMRQWMLKITDYAEALLEGLDDLDWPTSIKEMQRNWIGKSIGATVRFSVDQSEEKFNVFTTRPDTLFGSTYCVLSPEHELLKKIVTKEQEKQIVAYQEECSRKSELDRTDLSQEKTGVFTGSYAINPANKKKIPIWIADYVLTSYGTGAIMAVPAHDQRDYEFAKKFSIEIVSIIAEQNVSEEAWTGSGKLTRSGFLDGLSIKEAKEKMCSWLEEKELGKKSTNYRLRDWLFSRQRYWGEPFPLYVKDNGEIIPMKEDELPQVLPEVDSYQPSGTGESPLSVIDDWINVTLEDGTKVRRDSNTMPQWAGSCWYYLRYLDPHNSEQAWSTEADKYWMPVDMYIGGAEHAVLHLLYARFWHKVLYDLGHVHTKEPFQRLVNQGMILGGNGVKMSKSLGNVVNPDEVVEKYGADTLRLYEMFMGPLEKSKPWNIKGVDGISRFLSRVWRLVIDDDGEITAKINQDPSDKVVEKIFHETIKKVTSDLNELRFNTAISQMMICCNAFYAAEKVNLEMIKNFVLLLSPFAPHLGEELWQRLGGSNTLAYEGWPKFDESLFKESTVKIPVQINGKVRENITIPEGATQEEVYKIAIHSPGVLKYTEGKNVIKVIYINNKILNLVVK